MTRAWRLAVAFALLLSALACTVPVDLGGKTPVPEVTPVQPSPVPPSPTAPSPVPPSPTVPSPVPPTVTRRYLPHTNSRLGFSAEYPEAWEVEVTDLQDPDTGETIGKVAEFHSPYAPDAGYLQLPDISVQIIAAIEGSPLHVPTEEEYLEFVRTWVEDREQELTVNPSIVEVDGYKAVQTAYSGTDAFDTYTLVGYATFFVVEDRMFFIEGVAASENDEEIRRVYEHFMSSFEVLPLRATAQPTDTTRPADTATPVGPSPVPPTPTPPTIDACPPTLACIHVINYCGSGIYFTIADEMHTVEGNSYKDIQLPPGEYTYTVSLPRYESINDIITVEAGGTYFLPFTAEVR